MKKSTLLVAILSLSFVLSACSTQDENAVTKNTENTAKDDLVPVLDSSEKDNTENTITNKEEKFVASSSKDWQKMERVREGFSVKLPKGWYYVSNYKQAVEKGYSALIGFGDSSEVWKQEPPYEIEIISLKSDMDQDFENYVKEVGEKGNQKFVIKADEKYKNYVDLMAESFKFIEKK